MKLFIVFIIKVYQLYISPLLSPSCIYKVSCSTFTSEVVNSHGWALGLFFGVRRILSCNTLINHLQTKENLHV